jgi:hypothetical protein
MRPRTLIVWATGVTAVVIGIALHAALRRSPLPPHWDDWHARTALVAAGLFIAQAMVVAGDMHRRLIAPFPTYFDTAWTLAVRLILVFAFIGVLWGVLFLGAGLFQLIGLDWPYDVIRRLVFALPLSGAALGAAIHLTDVRPALVRGARTLVATLMSWLLPILTLIAACFLASLPITGLAALWSTRFATALLTGVGFALVLLINAAYQDGRAEPQPPHVMRIAASTASLLLVPITLLAIQALGLRVGQHGWTISRVAGACLLVILALHAAGYAWAVLSPTPWLRRLEPTNVAGAVLTLAILLAVMTPLADPARLAVSDQLARLASGRISVNQLNFAFLRFETGRYGIAALERLKADRDPALSGRALEALARTNPFNEQRRPTPHELSQMKVYPSGKTLPDSFVDQDWTSNATPWLAQCLRDRSRACEAILVDLNDDGMDEILLADGSAFVAVFAQQVGGHWGLVGTVPSDCAGVVPALKRGEFRRVPPRWSDIEAGGHQLRINTVGTANDSSCR